MVRSATLNLVRGWQTFISQMSGFFNVSWKAIALKRWIAVATSWKRKEVGYLLCLQKKSGDLSWPPIPDGWPDTCLKGNWDDLVRGWQTFILGNFPLDRYKSVKVSTTVRSQARVLPTCQGIRVMPSGRLLSYLMSPTEKTENQLWQGLSRLDHI